MEYSGTETLKTRFGRDEMLCGYSHPGYAESLAEFGTPREMPASGGWVLERAIPDCGCSDAIGCYPIYSCRDWAGLESDISDLEGELVSLTLVADPFGNHDLHLLNRCFDKVMPLKEHFVADTRLGMDKMVSGRHRRRARKVMHEVSVELCEDPALHTDFWVELYSTLAKRHTITGMNGFSRRAFEHQLRLPGAVMFRAMYDGEPVGAQLWFVQGEIGYCHLSAGNELGYALESSYALFWCSYEYFLDKLRWLHIGGGAGINGNGSSGLVQFKRGWSTETRIAYICSRILDREKYSEIVKAKQIPPTDYFPAYRIGEFG